jgi:rhodanese-related sulfurtransferase
MKKIVLFLSVGVLFVLVTSGFSIAAKGYADIDALGVKALMDNEEALVVFPLSPMEFDHKHIKGSVNIIPAMMEYELPTDKGKALVFYCLGVKCVASWRAAEKAVELGYKNVYAFREGLPSWEKAEYPLASTKKLPDVVVKKISTDELAAMLFSTDMILLDINLEEDAHKFHIESAKRKHIPLDELNENLSQLPKDKKIAVMCLKGKRSVTAVRYLSGNGYNDVVLVEGGIQKWVLEGRPVKKEIASM